MKYRLLILILATPFLVQGQFENRLNLYTGLGIIPFESDAQVQTESVFQGYRTVPFLHAYLGYSINRKVALGGTFRQIITSKENYLLSNTIIGFGVKYNFIPYDKPISPFAYADFGINYTYISQQQNTQTVTPEPSTDPTEISVNEFTLQEPEIQLNVFPSFSALVGVGAEFTLKNVRKKNLGFFLFTAYSISNTADKNNVQEIFTKNTSQFNYLLICGGLRFSFLQRKSIY